MNEWLIGLLGVLLGSSVSVLTTLFNNIGAHQREAEKFRREYLTSENQRLIATYREFLEFCMSIVTQPDDDKLNRYMIEALSVTFNAGTPVIDKVDEFFRVSCDQFDKVVGGESETFEAKPLMTKWCELRDAMLLELNAVRIDLGVFEINQEKESLTRGRLS